MSIIFENVWQIGYGYTCLVRKCIEAWVNWQILWMWTHPLRQTQALEFLTEGSYHSNVRSLVYMPSFVKWVIVQINFAYVQLFYAIRSQNMITRATNKKSRDRNCSSICWGVPGAAGGGLPSLMLKAVAKIPKGKAPIPKDIWNPPSPKPNPWNPPRFSGSGLCPCGLGGVRSLGSCWPVLPRPYNGMTLSRLMPALHTGQTCLFGLVSNHWCKHGQQNKCPQRLITASLDVSRQMLHSKVLSWFPVSPAVELLEPGFGVSVAVAPETGGEALAMDFLKLSTTNVGRYRRPRQTF